MDQALGLQEIALRESLVLGPRAWPWGPLCQACVDLWWPLNKLQPDLVFPPCTLLPGVFKKPLLLFLVSHLQLHLSTFSQALASSRLQTPEPGPEAVLVF